MPLGFQIAGGEQVVMWWAVCPLVEIGSTELPNSCWAKAHPAHPLMASRVHSSMRLLKLGYLYCTLKRWMKVFPILTSDVYDYQNELTNNKTNNAQSQRKVWKSGGGSWEK